MWANRGFDIKAIEDRSAPQDKSEHPVLGTVYRVAIIHVGTALTLGEERRQRASVTELPALSTGGSAPSTARFQEGYRQRIIGQEPSQKELKRQAKALEKEVKQAEKKQKVEEAARKKVVQRQLVFAEKVVARLTEPVENMGKNQEQPAALQCILRNLKSDAKAALDIVKDILKDAEQFVANPDGESMDGLDWKHINEKLKSAKKFDTSITMVLASIERANQRV